MPKNAPVEVVVANNDKVLQEKIKNVSSIKIKLLKTLEEDGSATEMGVTAMAEIIAEVSGCEENLVLAINHIRNIFAYNSVQAMNETREEDGEEDGK